MHAIKKIAHTACMARSALRGREGQRVFLSVLFLFFFTSFIGWCMEKSWFYFAYGVNADRGFLTLPFCTIYGSSLVVIRLLFGLPVREGEGYPRNLLRVLLYAAFSALAATAAELFTGLFFENAFGVRLWSYRGYPHEFMGFVCLPMSAAWGLLITAGMAFVWTPLERVLKRAPVAALAWTDGVLSVALLLDFFLCVSAFF